jgi:hypothetical protein
MTTYYYCRGGFCRFPANPAEIGYWVLINARQQPILVEGFGAGLVRFYVIGALKTGEIVVRV